MRSLPRAPPSSCICLTLQKAKHLSGGCQVTVGEAVSCHHANPSFSHPVCRRQKSRPTGRHWAEARTSPSIALTSGQTPCSLPALDALALIAFRQVKHLSHPMMQCHNVHTQQDNITSCPLSCGNAYMFCMVQPAPGLSPDPNFNPLTPPPPQPLPASPAFAKHTTSQTPVRVSLLASAMLTVLATVA